MKADRICDVGHARRLAGRTLPRLVVDFVDGGAEDASEAAWRANPIDTQAFRGFPYPPTRQPASG